MVIASRSRRDFYIFFEYMRDRLYQNPESLKRRKKIVFFVDFLADSGSFLYMKLDNRFIGISAYANSGKDTVCSLMNKRLLELGYRPVKFPFASELKQRIDPFLAKEIGISAFTSNKEEKDIIRPFLVLYGETARDLHEDYWVEIVKEKITSFDEIYARDGVSLFPVITDVRYENEVNMIKSLGGKILHIEREGIVAPNPSEEKNHPLVKSMADITLDWPNFKDQEEIDTKGYELVVEMLKDVMND